MDKAGCLTPKRGRGQNDEDDQDSTLSRRMLTSFWGRLDDDSASVSVTDDVKLAVQYEVIPINTLILASSNCAVVARVTLMNFIKPGSTFFKFHIMDASAEMSVVVFGSKAETLSKTLKVNEVYKFENFAVRKEFADHLQFAWTDLQILLKDASLVTLIPDAVGIPDIPFNFISVAQIKDLADQEKVDIIGVVAEVWDRSGKYRHVRITDESKSEVILTVWEQNAEKIEFSTGMVVAIRRANVNVVKSFGNGISAGSLTLIWPNPAIPDGRQERMRSWFQRELAAMQQHETKR